MLGWQASGGAAARDLGMSTAVLHTWVKDWRRWLLLLDPSGAMEARVGLGQHAEDVEPNQQVRETAERGDLLPSAVSASKTSSIRLADLRGGLRFSWLPRTAR
ncbi:hypothetical protein PI87_26960 [Ralstonia sp. A12]|uniref:DUF746 domain-containing protein n=1 Tax=Ralstonia sp. A12 TaxID=1217052 RepID=UPI000573935C|nr:hypothetical protein PI87_26960 [Ralstonia sp. A12]